MCPFRLREVKQIISPTFSYRSETWTWNRAQQARARGVGMNYLKGEVTRD